MWMGLKRCAQTEEVAPRQGGGEVDDGHGAEWQRHRFARTAQYWCTQYRVDRVEPLMHQRDPLGSS
jgi:hypothetical protein